MVVGSARPGEFRGSTPGVMADPPAM